MSRNILRTLLLMLTLAASVCSAESELKEIPSFQDGLQPRFGRPITPNTAAVLLNNFYYDGDALKLLPKWIQWSAAFDTENRIKDLYEFYDKQTDSSQILCSVSDQVFYTADNGATFSRIGPTGSSGLILVNDSIFLAGGGSDFFHQMAGSENWRLYIYVNTDTVALDVRQILSDDALVVEKNTYGDVLGYYPWVVTPVFDTASALQFDTWRRRCFISDGVRETVKWTGSEFDGGHYIVDSAKIKEWVYNDTTSTLDLTLLTRLAASEDELQEYADYHYGAVYVYNRFPLGDSLWVTPYMPIDSCEDDYIRLFADLVDAYSLTSEGKLYIVKPLNEGWAFHIDTLLTGTIDSITTLDTLDHPLMNLLTFYGMVTLPDGDDSIDIDFTTGTGYASADSYQVVLNYISDPDSSANKYLVKKMDGNTFRVVRPAQYSQRLRYFQYITVGVPDATVDRDSTRYWQWGFDSTGTVSKADTISLSEAYDDVDSFAVCGTQSQHANSNFYFVHGWKFQNTDASTAKFTNSQNFVKYSWLSVGKAAGGAQNSLADTLLIQYGVDTIPAGATEKWVYFEERFKADYSYGLAVSRIDTLRQATGAVDSTWFELQSRILWTNGFRIDRKYPSAATKEQIIFTWIAVGTRSIEPSDLNFHLVYDMDKISRDSTSFIAEYNSPFYLFKLTDGVYANNEWWSTGVRCSYWDRPGDSLALKVLVPPVDYDSVEIPIPPNDSSQYAVLRLSMYPKAKSARTQFQRMWFQVPPSRIYFSDLYDYNTISLVNYEDVGGDDDDEIMNFEMIENQREVLKTHFLYAQSGNNLVDMQTMLRSANFGSWCSGFHAAYLGEQFYLHKSGIFTFDASSPDITVSRSVRPFFTDSMDLERINTARAAVINDNFMALIVSIPGYSGNKTLLLDLDHSVWSTWSDNMGCYLSRTSPGRYDSTLAATADDSAAIYVLRDTMATGNAQYISAFMDFGYPLVLKKVEKVGVTYEMEAGSWLLLNIYQDSSVTPVYTDSITSTTPATITEHHTFNIPPLREAIWFAVGLESHGADTCNIMPPVSMKMQPIREDGGL